MNKAKNAVIAFGAAFALAAGGTAGAAAFRASPRQTAAVEIHIDGPAARAEQSAKPRKRVLQKFTTEFSPDAANRNHNITLAAKAINGVAVRPGEVFSYNETVGPTSKARGYKLSQIFKNGRKLKGYGGGVCQVSSTLYNAVDAAGMQIVERHPHSRKVSYVPPGRDAATSYGSSDFKFKNTQPYPIVIEAATTASSVTVTISAAA